MFDILGKVRPQIRTRAWASPGQGQSLDQLATQLLASNNQILAVDVTNNRILIADVQETHDAQYGCRFCLANGLVLIVDTETQLLAHCDENHPDWRDALDR